MELILTASITEINPNFSSGEGFELSNQSIIPNTQIPATFVPFEDVVEFWVYDINNNLISGVENFQSYTLIDSPSSDSNNGNTSEISFNPELNAFNQGFDTGVVNVVYNFLNYKLGTMSEGINSDSVKYYISEISSDRTELRLKSNFIPNDTIVETFYQLQTELNSNEYFDEFYLNFGDNQFQVCVNLQLDTSTSQFSVLIKLFDALPPEFSEKDEVSVVVKPAESIAYQVVFPEPQNLDNDFNFIKGPNYNLNVNEFTNNSTNLQSKNELLQTNSSGSLDNLQNILNKKGITLTPNYSYNTFNEFVNFSSAERRIENFIEKVAQIQSSEADIDTLNTLTGPTSESFQVSSSIAAAYTNIQNLITNFDGYEYYLYYATGSSSYPKTGSAYPYELLPTTDVSVSVWLGSSVEGSQYYGGIALSASLYDNNNQNWLYYTIPEFIRDNSDNNQYLEFSNMVGQHFDEVWLYTRAITEKLNTTSQLDDGVPLDLADDVITSLGYTGFGNNFNNQDNFIGLTGEDNGVYVPPTGSELITNYIAVNNGNIINYWDPNYSFENYVEEILNPGFPYAIDKVSKEIYKRLYHNMNYLVKKKGTISGLRQLINIWGIPNTILRINEFGGKDRDNSDDYDLWYNRYSYAFHPASTQNVASASVVFPWMPLERNRIAEGENIVPDNFQFRFKTTGYPSSSFSGDFFTQSLAVKKSDGDNTSTEFDFGISLFYSPPITGSYSGSYSNEYENWGTMRFHMSGAAADGGVATSNDIYLPFFDKGWWSVMLQRDQHVSASDNTTNTTYTLYAKNKIYNGNDGSSIGFEGSASIVSNISESINESWNKFGTTANDGIYLGGFISGSTVGGVTTGLSGKSFTGSLQEFRYYSNNIPEATFNDFVMNPESIEGNAVTGSERSFDIVNFRAPLGNELENVFRSSLSSSYTDTLTSMHPAIQGNANILITGSFWNPNTSTTSSDYNVLYYENTTLKTFSKTNTEVYFLDQPAIGFRNRISDKIQIRDGDDYGTILSNRISIQQDYQISRSYTENINNLEVAFSPQDEVNDDIIASFGYGVIGTAIADPRFISSSDSYYPKLREIADSYFEKYTKGNVYDYLRLIKYFDNSIFKAIKSYVPARTNVSTGIVIKQHMLERNRFQPVQISEGTIIATTPSGALNTPIIMENIVLTASIDTINQELPSGSTGGSANKFNYLDSSFLVESGPNQGNTYSTPFGSYPNTQSWTAYNETVVGLVTEIENTQDEFYNGEYSGSELEATSQSLFYNPFLKPSTTPIVYNTEVYNLNPSSYEVFGVGSASWSAEVGTPVPTASYALGYTFVPSSSLIIATASLGDEWTSGSYIYDAEQFAFYQNNILGPTSTTSASYMDPQNKPLIVGLYKVDWSQQQFPNLSQYQTSSYPYTLSQGTTQFMNFPTTRSFFPTYVGMYAGVENVSDDYGGGQLAPYLNSSVVSGIGNNALKNPTPSGTPSTGSYKALNLATPGFRLDLTSFFPSPSPLPDSDYGNLDTRIVDSLTFYEDRTSLLTNQTPFSSSVPSLNLDSYTFLNHAPKGSALGLTRPIQQYGDFDYLQVANLVTASLPLSASGGGIVNDVVFARVNGPSSSPVTSSFYICTTNTMINELIDNNVFANKNSIAQGMDVYDWNSGTPQQLSAGTYTRIDDFGIAITGSTTFWTDFTIPDLGAGEGWFIDDFTINSSPVGPFAIQYAIKPNNNYQEVTASWDNNTLLPGIPVPGINVYDIMAINNQSYNGVTGSMDTIVSNRYLIYNYYASQQIALAEFSSNTPITGTASLYTYPVNWTSSFPTDTQLSTNGLDQYFSGSFQTIPSAFIVNNISQGDINNTPSFVQHPTINFQLNTTGSPSPGTSSNPNGGIIDTSLLVTASTPFIDDSVTAYLYQPTSRFNTGLTSGEGGFNLSSATSQYNIDPYIEDIGIGFFENTIYYATPNNFNENRPNPFKFLIENQNGINTISNIQAIISGSAILAETPVSNYTSRASIIPKYNGSKVTSANYNFYTPPESTSALFANGTTGSWGGDKSYGKTAVIDKNPIYFAHFKSSKNNYELDNTYTFIIDQLIQCPFTDISNRSFLEIADLIGTSPITVNVDGSGTNIASVNSTFEKGRKASIIYQVPIQSYFITTAEYAVLAEPLFQTQSVTTNYQTLTIGDSEIFQGALEYQTIISTRPTPTKFIISGSMTIGENISLVPPLVGGNYTSGSVSGSETISYLGIASQSYSGGSTYFGYNSWAQTGSGYIDLTGGPAKLVTASLSPDSTGIQTYYGNFLALAHSYNYWVKDQLYASYTASAGNVEANFNIPGIPTASSTVNSTPVLSTNPLNYNIFNFSSSEAGANVLGYENYNLPFIIERGDEIRVTYNVASSSLSNGLPIYATNEFITQDFTVEDVYGSPLLEGSLDGDISPMWFIYGSSVAAEVLPERRFDRIGVSPDPSTLAIPIPDGSIYQFTVRKRVNADNRVIVYQTPPINSAGSQTPSGDGFLIPNDFTQIQKGNVQTLINALKSQNAVSSLNSTNSNIINNQN